MKYVHVPIFYKPDPDDEFAPVDLEQDYDEIENEALYPNLTQDEIDALFTNNE